MRCFVEEERAFRVRLFFERGGLVIAVYLLNTDKRVNAVDVFCGEFERFCVFTGARVRCCWSGVL